MIEVFGVVALVMTLTVVAIPSLRNFTEGGKQGAAARTVSALNSAVQQFDQSGGLLTARVPVPIHVARISDPQELPELAVLNLLRSGDAGGQVADWQEPVFDNEGYRAVWVNGLNAEQLITDGLGGDRSDLAESLIKAGEGGRFEVIGPEDDSGRMGIVGFRVGPSVSGSSNVTTGVTAVTATPATSLAGSLPASSTTTTGSTVLPASAMAGTSAPVSSSSVGVDPQQSSGTSPAVEGFLLGGNIAPMLTLGSSKPVVRVGEPVVFSAVGRDLDDRGLTYRFRVNGGQWTDYNSVSVFVDEDGAKYEQTFSLPGTYVIDAQVRDARGAISQVAEVTVTVLAVQAQATASGAQNVTPIKVNLTANPIGGVRSQDFLFAAVVSGDTSTAPEFSFRQNNDDWTAYSNSGVWVTNFDSLGEQRVQAKVKSASGGEVALSDVVTVQVSNRLPTVNLSASPLAGGTRAEFVFAANASDQDGDSLEYRFALDGEQWNEFGKDNVFRRQFELQGVKTARVQVRDSNGGISDSEAVSVTVENSKPSVVMQADRLTGERSDDFTFRANGTDMDGGNLMYSFRVGNSGDWSAEQDSPVFSHKFETPGMHTLYAKVRNNSGEVAESNPVQVSVQNLSPVVKLQADKSVGARADTFLFSAAAEDPDGDRMTFIFDSVEGEGSTLLRSFDRPGSHTVTVRAKDEFGGLSEPVSTTVSVENQIPNVTLSANPARPLLNDPVEFAASAQDDDRDLLYRFRINLGEWGRYSSRSKLDHSFSTTGMHAVQVQVRDPWGAESPIAVSRVSVSKEDVPVTARAPSLPGSAVGNVGTVGNIQQDAVGASPAAVPAVAPTSAGGGVPLAQQGAGNTPTALTGPSSPLMGTGGSSLSPNSGGTVWDTLTPEAQEANEIYGGGVTKMITLDADGGLSNIYDTSDFLNLDPGLRANSVWSYNLGTFLEKTSSLPDGDAGRALESAMVTPLLVDWNEDGVPSLLAGPDWQSPRARSPDLTAYREVDLDGSGPSSWEWVGPEDALLVDKDQAIETPDQPGTFLFGNHTWGRDWSDGFSALAELDKDQDGFIRGEEMDRIGIWIDANTNARVDKGEITSAEEHQIAAIRVKADDGAAGGNYMSQQGLKFEDGSSLIIWDWWSAASALGQLNEKGRIKWTRGPADGQWNLLVPTASQLFKDGSVEMVDGGELVFYQTKEGVWFVRALGKLPSGKKVDFLYFVNRLDEFTTWSMSSGGLDVVNQLFRADGKLMGMTVLSDGRYSTWKVVEQSGEIPFLEVDAAGEAAKDVVMAD